MFPRTAIEVAHLAAPGLIHAVEVGHDPARSIILRLTDELAARGWLGDDELLDEFDRVLRGSPTALRPVPVDLDELASHLDAPTQFDAGWMLEIATGHMWPVDPLGTSGIEMVADFDDPDAFIAVVGLGPNPGYSDMEDFIATVTDDLLARTVERRHRRRRCVPKVQGRHLP